MADQQREFKGIWIPREVWLDSKLNALDKVIFAEIDSFSSSGKVCFQNNATIAEFCQCSESKVSKTVSKLIDLGYIRCVSFDGRKRYLQSCLVNFTTLDSKKSEAAEQNLLFPPNTNKPTSKSTVTPYNPPEGEQPKPKRKRKSDSAEEVEAAIKAFGYPESTNERLREWLEVRNAKRTPNTVSAIQKCIKTLPDMARKSNLGIDAYLDQVIMRGWAAFYEIKAYQPNNGAYSRNPEPPAPQYREAK